LSPRGPDFFLADFAPHDAGRLAARLRDRQILVKPLGDPRLGPGYMRVARVLDALRALL
jgi:histidinol-phosphate aminotransferase